MVRFCAARLHRHFAAINLQFPIGHFTYNLPYGQLTSNRRKHDVKTPALSVVPPPARSALAPPRPLGNHGTALWAAIQREYAIQDSGGTELLATACAALDTAELLAEEIAKDGAVIRTPKGVSRNPAIRDQLAARALCIRTLEKLGINVSVTPLRGPGRPPKSYGY